MQVPNILISAQNQEFASTINPENIGSNTFIKANKALNFTQTQRRQQRTKSWSGFNKKKASIDYHYSLYDLGRSFNSSPLFTCNSKDELNLPANNFIVPNLDNQCHSYNNLDNQIFKLYLTQLKSNNSLIPDKMRNINSVDSGSIDNNNFAMNNKKIVPLITGTEKFCSNLRYNNSLDNNFSPVPTNSFDQASLVGNLPVWSTNNFGEDSVQRLEVNQKRQSLTKSRPKLLLASSRSNSNTPTDKPNESGSIKEDLNESNKSDIHLNIAKVANAFQVKLLNGKFLIDY